MSFVKTDTLCWYLNKCPMLEGMSNQGNDNDG